MSAASLLAALRHAGMTVSVAESCTGGLLAAALTDPAGASDVFDSGCVTYSNKAKEAFLGVSPETLSAQGAVSEEVAREMAEGLRARTGTSLSLSITGIAGPGGSDHKPEGRVCFACADATGCHAQTVEFGPLGRAHVRAAAVAHALKILQEKAQP